MEEITELVNEISNKLTLLENKLKDYDISKLSENDMERIKIRFPRGYLRYTDDFRKRLSFIHNDTLKRNLSYHFMLSDVYKWILNRFDIAFTAKEMIIKAELSLLGNIIAAIVTNVAKEIKPGQKKRGINASLSVLVKNDIINEELKKGITCIWEIRCKEHIENLKDWELNKYSLSDYNKAIIIWQELESQLKKAEINGKL